MKLPVTWIDIRIAIREDQLIVHFTPRPESRCVATFEAIDIGYIPVDISAWISRLERRSESDPI